MSPHNEGDSGTTTYTFTVTLTGEVDTGFDVDYDTADDSATTGDGDYNSASNTLSFSGGDGETQTFSVTVAGDTRIELDEAFLVNLSNVQIAGGRNVTIADAQGIGTIANDDSATVSVDSVTVNEEDGTAQFTVTLSNPVDTDCQR